MMGENIDRDSDNDIVREICADIARAVPHSVVLNFECCSHAGDSGFECNNAPDVMKLTRMFLDRQHMVMYGDFTVKVQAQTHKLKKMCKNFKKVLSI